MATVERIYPRDCPNTSPTRANFLQAFAEARQPVRWSAYAGVLGALGIGFMLKTVYLWPVTILFLLIAVGALAFRAGSRRGYGPFIVGLAAFAIVLIGKFVFVSDVAMDSGIVLMVVASICNAWPRSATSVNSGVCPICAPEGQASHSQQAGAKEVSP